MESKYSLLTFYNIFTSNMWPLILAIAVVITGADDSGMVCPGLEMTYLPPQCISDRDVCPQNSTWEPMSKVCDMCGGCTEYLQPGDPCEEGGTKCKPGYACNEQYCTAPNGSCQHDLDNNNNNINWEIKCDGSEYAPVQCKGQRASGRCFCVDKNGNRIFGEQQWAVAENMTCACSRRVQELQDQGRKDVTLHCNEQGNYEELQCDNGVCWCTEEKTGTPFSSILPENMMKMLPCYENASLGSGYLRQCESLLIAQKRIEIVMAAHNSTNPNFPYINCELDGSYGAVKQEGNLLYCAWKDNTRLENYAEQLNERAGMNCRCARDTKMYGDKIQHSCLANGNYRPDQYANDGSKYCIDSDGFPNSSDDC